MRNRHKDHVLPFIVLSRKSDDDSGRSILSALLAALAVYMKHEVEPDNEARFGPNGSRHV